ncbi:MULTISPECIES: DUF4359 domain-containing protein [unclassified Leptolyngbya]|uniref:DUF4359 domain-containing protein n=1 Tax=unclassified Leptolyngbya TaxID=2650499 RepID=UPI001683258A|nr:MULTISPECIES: DUF4359 domain-containing protein [unclassified Leptolyngbya]MBD1911532.1 DUF4359 domain-containing protein [Leptolyngbya sp. FACHB-8]MBD2155566.1 DUF4359 domain-containing protein [Leptolyngbya sp. FACHB-16]
MKGWKVGVFGGAIALGVVGAILVATNPQQSRYNEYATAKLVTYLNDSFCADLPNLFGNDLQEQCVELVAENHSELQEIVAENTQRQNFGVVSLYRTQLRTEELLPEDVKSFVPASMLPTYEVESIGGLQQFWTYRAEQQR